MLFALLTIIFVSSFLPYIKHSFQNTPHGPKLIIQFTQEYSQFETDQSYSIIQYLVTIRLYFNKINTDNLVYF